MKNRARLAQLESIVELQECESDEVVLDIPKEVLDRYLAAKSAGTFPESMSIEDIRVIALAPVLSGEELE